VHLLPHISCTSLPLSLLFLSEYADNKPAKSCLSWSVWCTRQDKKIHDRPALTADNRCIFKLHSKHRELPPGTSVYRSLTMAPHNRNILAELEAAETISGLHTLYNLTFILGFFSPPLPTCHSPHTLHLPALRHIPRQTTPAIITPASALRTKRTLSRNQRHGRHHYRLLTPRPCMVEGHGAV
jgi:hypothetical protein